MKETLLFLFVIFSALHSADAQWHERFCGVTDINNCTTEEFDCLWESANNISRTGRTITKIGFISVGVGAIAIPAAYSAAYSGGGYILFYIGFASLVGAAFGILVGIPIWIVGASRKSQLKTNPHFKSKSLESINIAPALWINQVNNSYAFGLTASLVF